MKFYRAGLTEFLVFMGVAGALIALHSRRLDNMLAITWLTILLAGSAFLAYKGWTSRNEPRPTALDSRWSAILPPRVIRWMLGESDRNDSGDRDRK